MKNLLFALVFAASSNAFASSWQSQTQGVNATQIVAMDDVVSSDGAVEVRVVSLLDDPRGIYKIVVYVGDQAFESAGYASTAGEYSLEKKEGVYQLKMDVTVITAVSAADEWTMAQGQLSMNMMIDAEGKVLLK